MPALTFTAPPHPSTAVNKKPAVTQDPQHPDPHLLPSFSPSTFEHHNEPVIYLPPLLSSLPASLPSDSVLPVPPPSQAPLHTESRLPHIDPASLSLHRALHHFHPATPSYAAVPYAEGFNWSELELPEDEEREWYVVAFRSKRRDGSDGTPLYEADRLAHEEAVQNGGLIMYWYGVPDPTTGLNLATCIWQSRKHALAANSRPHHIRAMRLAAASFSEYSLERHVLRKVRGERGIHVEQYTSGDVGW
ncbi:hypothetical protein BOTBODRAFT_178432 [Botryobasidium botryosum FD-172 SS1]|uniref:Uncharacterized protein n=1 Tax=Botryobasidium botryosum (strain FD-172 SS1) TaxID=930990 RepID=A0A067M2P6_BOTB1|nr:hypothetical protein BOTBODRAFT_178432 [Botryobasidium botryosum FD-172 SS1]